MFNNKINLHFRSKINLVWTRGQTAAFDAALSRPSRPYRPLDQRSEPPSSSSVRVSPPAFLQTSRKTWRTCPVDTDSKFSQLQSRPILTPTSHSLSNVCHSTPAGSPSSSQRSQRSTRTSACWKRSEKFNWELNQQDLFWWGVFHQWRHIKP